MPHTPIRYVLAAALLLAPVGPAAAQSYTWNGLGGSPQWGVPQNWESGVAPPLFGSPTTAIVLTGTAQTTTTMERGGFNLNSLTFAAEAGAFTVNQGSPGDFFVFQPGPLGPTGSPILPRIDQFSANAQTINFPLTGFQLNADLLLGGTGSGSLTINGQLIGPGRLILNGPYTVTLTPPPPGNSHGGIALNAGTLRTGSDGAFGIPPTAITFGGGTLQYTAAINSGRTINLNAGGGTIDANGFAIIFGNGGAQVAGPGRLTLTSATGSGSFQIFNQLQQAGGLSVTGTGNVVSLFGNNSFSGGVSVSGGATLAFDFDGRLGNPANTITLDGGTLRLIGPGGFPVNRPITLGAGGGTISIDAAVSPVGFLGAVSGIGGLTKSGTSRIGLLTANTYSGPTTVTGGFLDLVHNQAAQNTTITLAGGTLGFFNVPDFTLGGLAGTTDLMLANANSVSVGNNNASTTYAGNLSGGTPQGLFKVGTGTWTLTGTNMQGGPLNISAGTVVAGSPGALSPNAPVGVAPSGTLDLNGFNYTVTATNPLNAAGTVRLNGASLTVQSGSAMFQGAVPMGFGTITVSGAGTANYRGATLTNGFLAGNGLQTIGPATGFNTVTFNNVTSFNGTQITVLNGMALALNNSTIGGVLNVIGSAAWTNGSLTSSGVLNVNTPTANVTGFTSQGVINISGSGGRITNAGSPLVLGGGSRTFVGLPPAGQRNATILLGGRPLELNGGLLVNNGDFAGVGNGGIQQGTVNVNFGSLAKGTGYYDAVNVTDGGKYAPGNSIANATGGSLTLNSGSTYEFEINRATGIAGGGGGSPPVGWDLQNLNVALNVNSTTVSPATIQLVSRNAADTGPGLLPDFNPAQSYQWLAFRVNTGGTINGFSSDKFTFDTASFANLTNPTGVGTFSLVQMGNDVFVTYTPVPEPTGVLAVAALAAVGWGWCRRRRFGYDQQSHRTSSRYEDQPCLGPHAAE